VNQMLDEAARPMTSWRLHEHQFIRFYDEVYSFPNAGTEQDFFAFKHVRGQFLHQCLELSYQLYITCALPKSFQQRFN